MLKVEHGSIYNTNGCIIEQPDIIYDTDSGLMRYGNAEKLRDHYDRIIEKYRKAGMFEMTETTKYAEFDRYFGVLDIEEIKTLFNYFIFGGAAGEKIHTTLSLDAQGLKAEIAKYKDMGY